MDGATLKSRAVVFAACAGGIAFFLSLLVTANASAEDGDYARALIPAIVCAIMCWACTQRTVANTAEAIDVAVERLSAAAAGDLESAIPPRVVRAVPPLATAMDSLFSQLKLNLDRVERVALFDPVTALPNRASFRGTCEAMLAAMPAQQAAALVFIDLDQFKAVNDTRGHAVGDMLLAQVAARLRGLAARIAVDLALAQPVVGRLAGDEFTMFLPVIRDVRDAEWVGDEIVALLGEPFEIEGQAEAGVGASVGVALHPDHGRTLHDLMRAADAAMYHAKAGGRGRVEHFGVALAADLAARSVLEDGLRRAIRETEFALVFQPQLRLGGDGDVAVEALLRWRDPVEGVRLPATFLKRAEETGLIVEIGEWVVAEVAAAIARWHARGLNTRLAINVSPRQLAHAGFFQRLRGALHAAGAPARLIELEIGETMAMRATSDVIESIAALRADGARVAIDGFGAGYSNVARLRALPLDRIKLDRSLIAPVAENDSARAIVQSMIGFIHALGLEAVGEGIETEAQWEVLRILGCDVVQGFGVAQPMDEARLIKWIEARQAPARRITSA